MLVRHKTSFTRGAVMLVSFAALFTFLLSPMLADSEGKSISGLQYADGVFNELSKGSSYFIPAVRSEAERMRGRSISVSVLVKKEGLAPLAERLLRDAGVTQSLLEGDRLSFIGDLGEILVAVTEDSDALYHNDADTVSGRHEGEPALKTAAAWWYLLKPAVKELQKQRLLEEAKAVDVVLRRALEPGNNFFSVPAAKVSEHVLLLCLMLAFYVLYTLWYGFSIFTIFEGVGLAMTKAKHKQES